MLPSPALSSKSLPPYYYVEEKVDLSNPHKAVPIKILRGPSIALSSETLPSYDEEKAIPVILVQEKGVDKGANEEVQSRSSRPLVFRSRIHEAGFLISVVGAQWRCVSISVMDCNVVTNLPFTRNTA